MYHLSEGTLAISQSEWTDKSLILLTNSSGQSITVSKDTLPWGMTFLEFAHREFAALSQQLKQYEELQREELTVEELPALFAEYQWQSNEGLIHQLTLMVNLPHTLLILTGSSKGRMSDNQKLQLLNLLKSFKPYALENE